MVEGDLVGISWSGFLGTILDGRWFPPYLLLLIPIIVVVSQDRVTLVLQLLI
jgi:hypothetical protein